MERRLKGWKVVQENGTSLSLYFSNQSMSLNRHEIDFYLLDALVHVVNRGSPEIGV